MAEFLMPILGADMTAGTLVDWRKQPGEAVHRGDIIAVVETDKADVEVEVFVNGVIEKLLVEPGAEVPVGTPLALIREEGVAAGALPPALPPRAAPAAPGPPAAVARPTRRAAPPAVAAGRQVVSPAARQLAEKLGVGLAAVTGTGPGGRIQLRDIEQAAAAAKAAPPHVRASPLARQLATQLGIDLATVTGTGIDGRIMRHDVERVAPAGRGAATPAPAPEAADRQARVRQAIAAAMTRSHREIPSFHLLTTIEMSRALAWLTTENERRPVKDRLLYGVLLIKAVAKALAEVPELNGVWADGRVIPRPDIHAGIAVALRGGGLVAPAIHHTDRLSLDELMAAFRDLVRRARAFSLRSSEMSDPTITITNLGEQGVEAVFGVIYPNQAALVGFGRIVERPWSMDGQIQSRPVMTATLTADHRVTDGHRGSLYLAAIDRLLQEPEQL